MNNLMNNILKLPEHNYFEHNLRYQIFMMTCILCPLGPFFLVRSQFKLVDLYFDVTGFNCGKAKCDRLLENIPRCYA